MRVVHDADIERVFLEAIALPAEEQRAFVEDALNADPARVDAVMELIAADEDNSDGTLERTAHCLREQMPRRLGPYSIVREIGQGGMGVVYEAIQARPSRKVALKVIRAGLATPRTLQRFELESDALGTLKHPGVVQVFEAGTATAEYEDGTRSQRAFIAMELVRGEDLLQHALTCDLSERLRLTADACDAIHHAHLHGIIHRDLKPGNILVTPESTIKILDFGVAKLAVDGDLAERATSLLTIDGHVFGTPKYRSPEHAVEGIYGADVRSDVYSLGVMLGELTKDMDAVAAGKRPPKSQLADLATIIQVATSSDIDRRYQSAAEFGEDLRRCIAREPIRARGESLAYRVRTLVRRHKPLAVTAGVALCCIVGALGVAVSSAIQSHRLAAQESQARSEASTARMESEAMVEFLSRMLTATDPAGLGRDVKVEDLLDQAAKELERTPLNQTLITARQHHAIAETYLSLGVFAQARDQFAKAHAIRSRILGMDHQFTLESESKLGTTLNTLGETAAAKDHLSHVYNARKATLGEAHVATLGSAGDLAAAMMSRGQFADARSLLTSAIATAKTAGLEETETVFDVQCVYASLLQISGDYSAAESLYRSLVAAEKQRLGDDRAALKNTQLLAANLARLQGRSVDALTMFQDLMERRKRLLGVEHPETLAVTHDLALLYLTQQQADKAEPLLREVISNAERALGPSHKNTLKAKVSLSLALTNQNRLDEASLLLHSTILTMEQLFGPESGDVADAHRLMGLLLRRAGDEARACEQFDKAIQGFTALMGDGYPLVAMIRMERAAALMNLNKLDDADRDLRLAFDALKDLPDYASVLKMIEQRQSDCCKRRGVSDPLACARQALGIAAGTP